MKLLLAVLDKVRPLFEHGGKLDFFYPIFELKDTFLFSQPDITKGGSHIRDTADLKRLMSFVILALIPCTLFGMWNAGHQYNLFNVDVISPDAGFVGTFLFINNTLLLYLLLLDTRCVTFSHEDNQRFLNK